MPDPKCSTCHGLGGYPKCPDCQNAGGSAASAGSSVSFRLLNRTDTIRPDDEFLTDDCQTWASVGDQGAKLMIGKPYSAHFFQPMRRREYPTNV